MKPIFILSLPRSGSTLLQRLLAAHSMVSSIAEPWLLLPLAGMADEGRFRQYSDFSSRLSARAVREMIDELPGGIDQYHEAIRNFGEEIYGALAGGGDRYFVEKTPRYYLIVDFIFDVFPDAKVIFLFRNPLDVLSSVVTTFSRNRFAMHHAHVDLFEGPVLLHEAHARYHARSFTLHYEELVRNPVQTSEDLFAYLDLPNEAAVLDDYRRVEFRGSMGDQTGNVKYSGVDSASVDRWKSVLGSFTRRRFALWYIRKLGPTVLDTFGVSLPELEQELRSLPFKVKGAFMDLFWLSASALSRSALLNVGTRQFRLPRDLRHKLD